jgi:Ni/Fe-hydrogenase b-type cytochrome subunit
MDVANNPDAPPQTPPAQGGDLVKRHRLGTRLWHWINALTMAVMVMSGLMILNAHPQLYWGHYGANPDTPWLVLGEIGQNNFPGWLTIPAHYSLADARLWHLAYAWVLVLGLLLYLLYTLFSGHLRRDLAIALRELTPAALWHEIREHARLRLPTGAAALRYNLLQRLAYGAVLFALLPLVILTGLTMSPGMDAALPWLVDLFGGRQSARSLHFIAMAGLVGFVVVHLAMVVLAGPINEVRSMITGWYRLPQERDDD